MIKINLSKIILATFCFIIIIVICVSIYREHKINQQSSDKISNIDYNHVENWLSALKKDNVNKGISIAKKMVTQSSPYVPIPDYMRLTKRTDINIKFFNPPFRKVDFKFWQDMYKLKSKIIELKNNESDSNIAKKIFLLVNKIKTSHSPESSAKKPAFFSEILENKKAPLVEKYLLLTQLFSQAGYDTQIVLLFKNIRKKPVHILATIKARNKNQHYTVDLSTKNIWPSSLEKLARNKEKFSNIWKDSYIKSLEKRMYKTISPAPAYRKINQQLYNYLKRAKDRFNVIPNIGKNPKNILKSFKSKLKKNSVAKKLNFNYGVEPFIMIKNYKNFPEKWLKDN